MSSIDSKMMWSILLVVGLLGVAITFVVLFMQCKNKNEYFKINQTKQQETYKAVQEANSLFQQKKQYQMKKNLEKYKSEQQRRFPQPVKPMEPFVQPKPEMPKQMEPFIQPKPAMPKQMEPFIQPKPSMPKRTMLTENMSHTDTSTCSSCSECTSNEPFADYTGIAANDAVWINNNTPSIKLRRRGDAVRDPIRGDIHIAPDPSNTYGPKISQPQTGFL